MSGVCVINLVTGHVLALVDVLEFALSIECSAFGFEGLVIRCQASGGRVQGTGLKASTLTGLPCRGSCPGTCGS